ncbi:MAG: DUF3576 domain-containing protein [Acidocella sp.]|nr:DUF3576 domain-containing protein [Acidocella sp.]
MSVHMVKKIVLVGLGLGALAGCSHIPAPQAASSDQINNTMAQAVPGAGLTGANAFPGIGVSLGKPTSGGTGSAQIQVNAYLWRATLDTLSFMPLVSADPFGGVIITDWYAPPASPGERFKVNAYILSKEMTANAVQVSVFRQVLQNGQWVNAPADPATATGLEDRILARAADLQAEAQNTR